MSGSPTRLSGSKHPEGLLNLYPVPFQHFTQPRFPCMLGPGLEWSVERVTQNSLSDGGGRVWSLGTPSLTEKLRLKQ